MANRAVRDGSGSSGVGGGGNEPMDTALISSKSSQHYNSTKERQHF